MRFLAFCCEHLLSQSMRNLYLTVFLDSILPLPSFILKTIPLLSLSLHLSSPVLCPALYLGWRPEDEEETLPRSHLTAALPFLHDSLLLSQTSFPDSSPGRYPVPLATNVLAVTHL